MQKLPVREAQGLGGNIKGNYRYFTQKAKIVLPPSPKDRSMTKKFFKGLQLD